ncbi:MAG: polyprenyl synthetase family protein [Spirochaetes bacterium]|nr:polyprenyl synthetase family protein [Spirochaetota bacterium]
MIEDLLVEKKSRFERDFFYVLKTSSLKSAPPQLREATLYALSGKNKRLRPILALEAARLSRLDDTRALAIATAFECLHTYSLVHDDLPAMDDDDLRRGQPSCHKKYGEATAILVGDLLQSLAFEFLATADVPSLTMKYFARAVGAQGMVAGQFLDMESQSTNTLRLHRLKTGRLIEAAVALPFFVAEGKLRFSIARWGRDLGLLFQITDDLLDASQDSATLGKTAGKDAAQNKKTILALMGVARAREVAAALAEKLAERGRELFSDSELFPKLPRNLLGRRA